MDVGGGATCRWRETCMSARRCSGTCWFVEGDFDIGTDEQIRRSANEERYVDDGSADLVRRFVAGMRERGERMKDIAEILDSPVSSVQNIVRSDRRVMRRDVATRMVEGMRSYAIREIAARNTKGACHGRADRDLPARGDAGAGGGVRQLAFELPGIA